MYVAKISAKRFVNVRTYGGKIMVDIREYYRDQSSGEMKPGKKGICLSLEQWHQLKKIVPRIDDKIDQMD